jgi:hypothetical protein
MILFDGANPQLSGDLAALVETLGDPEARLDYTHGTLPVTGGEWIFAARGITLFVSERQAALHVALYPATTAAGRARLRPASRQDAAPITRGGEDQPPR